jgi:hypothetical protein
MKNKIAYWISTGLVSAMMLFAAYSYLTAPETAAGFRHLGFPDYFRVELAIAKFLGALALLIPVVPRLLKGFAYAGFTITFISAFIAHLSSGDPMGIMVMPVVALVLLGVSYVTAPPAA